jgi:ribonucleoside-diphosphate reductase beta chain
MPSLFEKREAYKPFWYLWAYESFIQSEQMHWLAREVPLNDDVKDWKMVLTEGEKHLLTQIFRFFTQADVDVASGYIDRYLPKFKPVELRMMMMSIAAREAVHIQAYSMLIDEIGMPEVEYSAFMQYAEMKEKHEFFFQQRDSHDELLALAQDIAIFSAFGEGLQLFASFVILLNFTRFGKMKGMGQIVSWSIRDETHHVQSMLRVYHQLIKEEGRYLNLEHLATKIKDIAVKMVELEDSFIDLVYAQGELEGLEKDDVKKYIRYIADIRLQQLGLAPIFEAQSNPLPWVDVIVFGKEHTNFFENRATDYSKGAIEGNWEDAFN